MENGIGEKKDKKKEEEWVSLNVGGQMFTTTVGTLTVDKESMLAKMFGENWEQKASKDDKGAYMLDRDPVYFAPVLNFLRTRKLFVNDGVSLDGVLEEAEYFQVQELIELLHPTNRPDLTRKEIVCNRKDITFVGLRLMGIDFSKLDLGLTTFDNANLRNANFCQANLMEASFVKVYAPTANFSFTRATRASFNQCNIENCSFQNAQCDTALFQRANAQNADFQGANLEHVKFHSADLRGANFLGAKLNHCRFVGADLRGIQIDWVQAVSSSALMHDATISREEYDAIPLPAETKASLKMRFDDEAHDSD